MLVIGMTRFSVVTEPNLLSFPCHVGREYAQVYSEIYSEQRMKRRFELFENLCLPALIKMRVPKGIDFQYKIFVSKEMPAIWHKRLESIIPEWAKLIHVAKHENFFDRTREEAEPHPVYTFRLDDDDVLCPSYLMLVKRHAQFGKVLSLDTGYYVTAARGVYEIRCKTTPNIAIGLGYYGDTSIYNLGSHGKIATEAVRLCSRPYWIRTVHSHNISGIKLRPTNLTFEDAKIKLKSFRISDKALEIL